jgi:hypothetical protein
MNFFRSRTLGSRISVVSIFVASGVLFSNTGFGVNGMSGGNPRNAIEHIVQNYSFRSSMPTSFQMVGDTSVFGFNSDSFSLVVESTRLPACLGSSVLYKTVCEPAASDGHVGKFVVFWAKAAFWVEVRSTILSQEQKRALLESVILSFNYDLAK